MGSGNTYAELIYTIPYTPPRGLTKEYTGAATKAYVSFTRVKLDPTSTEYHFDYQIVQVTISSVTLKIRKYGSTRIQALKGQVLIIANAATSNYL